MMGAKLNAQVIIKNLQNMHEKSLPPTGARRRMELEYQDSVRPPARQGTTHGRTKRPPCGVLDVAESTEGQDLPIRLSLLD